MKILTNLSATPALLLGDEENLPVMLVNIGIQNNQDPETVEFTAESEALRRLGNDLINMADQLEARAEKLGIPLAPRTEPQPQETPEDIDLTDNVVVPFTGRDN